MGIGYNRAELQTIAEEKLDDSVTLFDNKSYSNAYYLAGYAVEIGLKACIARSIYAETVPDRALLNNFFNHEFIKLVGLAGLKAQLKAQQDNDPAFAANWAIVSEWAPEVRYESKDLMSAQLIIEAVSEPNSGVLKWIKAYW